MEKDFDCMNNYNFQDLFKASTVLSACRMPANSLAIGKNLRGMQKDWTSEWFAKSSFEILHEGY
jgi:hypothetical protein